MGSRLRYMFSPKTARSTPGRSMTICEQMYFCGDLSPRATFSLATYLVADRRHGGGAVVSFDDGRQLSGPMVAGAAQNPRTPITHVSSLLQRSARREKARCVDGPSERREGGHTHTLTPLFL